MMSKEICGKCSFFKQKNFFFSQLILEKKSSTISSSKTCQFHLIDRVDENYGNFMPFITSTSSIFAIIFRSEPIDFFSFSSPPPRLFNGGYRTILMSYHKSALKAFEKRAEFSFKLSSSVALTCGLCEHVCEPI
jgi:hypothetical protein